jgi:hypothetical protein
VCWLGDQRRMLGEVVPTLLPVSEGRQLYEAAREVLDDPVSAEPDDPRYQSRQVYEWFGMAALSWQWLEFQLATVLMADAHSKGEFDNSEKLTDGDIEKLRKWLVWINQEATMGRLVKELRRRFAQDDDLPVAVGHAVDVRNHLAHHFFIERRAEIRSSTGRSRMLRELLDAIEMFQDVSDRLNVTI